MKLYATPADQICIIPLDDAVDFKSLSQTDRMDYINAVMMMYTLPDSHLRTSDTTIFFCDGDDMFGGEPFCVRMYAATNATACYDYDADDFLPYGRALTRPAYDQLSRLVDVYLSLRPSFDGINRIVGMAYMSLPDGNCIAGVVEPRRETSLDNKIKEISQLPRNEKIHILLDISRAIDNLHSRGISHNDLKPANILVDNGEYYLADLDLSCRIGETSAGCGTAGYMSPEVAAKVAVTAASDIWAMANIINEIMYGCDLVNFSDLDAEDVSDYMKTFIEVLGADDDDDIKKIIAEIIINRPESITKHLETVLGCQDDDEWEDE